MKGLIYNRSTGRCICTQNFSYPFTQLFLLLLLSSSSSYHLLFAGIYIYIPETNYVPRKYNVAAILLLLFMVLISLGLVLNLLGAADK